MRPGSSVPTSVSHRFPASVRLRSRREFAPVQAHGRRVAARYLTVLGRAGAGESDRLGIIASRKLGGAVQRNRAKRRVREVFRRQEPLDVRARDLRPLDIVVIPRRESLTAPIEVIAEEFRSAVRKLRGLV